MTLLDVWNEQGIRHATFVGLLIDNSLLNRQNVLESYNVTWFALTVASSESSISNPNYVQNFVFSLLKMTV